MIWEGEGGYQRKRRITTLLLMAVIWSSVIIARRCRCRGSRGGQGRQGTVAQKRDQDRVSIERKRSMIFSPTPLGQCLSTTHSVSSSPLSAPPAPSPFPRLP